MFKVRGSKFEKTVMGYMRDVSEYFYYLFVVESADDYTMHDALENNFFSHFKYARYATDVTFQ